MSKKDSELAKALGLSREVVQRILAGKAEKYGIPAETVERVLREAGALGYEQANAAHGSRPKGRPAIGVLLTNLSNPFFARLADAIDEFANKAGYLVLLAGSGDNLESEKLLVEELRARGAEGLIVAAAGPDYEHLRRLQAEDYPVVLLDRVFEDFDCDWVAVENQYAACRLVEVLADYGARRIALIGGQMQASTMRLRLEGYRAALRRSRFRFDKDLVFLGDFTEVTGILGAEHLLDLSEPPDAIFCSNNLIFTGCLDRLAEAPKVPWSYLPIACFDEVPFMAHLGRPLVVASQPERTLGQRATEFLIERLRSGKPGSRLTKPYKHDLLAVEQKTFGF